MELSRHRTSRGPGVGLGHLPSIQTGSEALETEMLTPLFGTLPSPFSPRWSQGAYERPGFASNLRRCLIRSGLGHPSSIPLLPATLNYAQETANGLLTDWIETGSDLA